MAVRYRQTPPSRPLAEAARAVSRATQELLPAAPGEGGPAHEQLREAGWQLVHLTGGLTETVASLAVRLDEHARTRLLRTHEGGDPSVELAQAARALTELRQALETAEAAAREYHTRLSRLVVDADPTLPAPGEQHAPRSRRRRRRKGR